MRTNDFKQMLMAAFIAALVMMFLVLVSCKRTLLMIVNFVCFTLNLGMAAQHYNEDTFTFIMCCALGGFNLAVALMLLRDGSKK
jgi:hypothetical protein